MKKQTKQIIVLAGILAICCAGYLLLRSFGSDGEQTAEGEGINIASLENIVKLSFGEADEPLEFTKTDGAWSYDGDVDFPLDQSYLTNLESQLSQLTAVRSFEDAEGLKAYGLAEPRLILEASTENGEAFGLSIGDETQTEYYAMKDDSSTIYTISSTLVAAIDHQLIDLVQLEEFPALSESNMTAIVFSGSGRKQELRKETLEAEEGEEDAVSYRWTLTTEEGETVLERDNQTLSRLLDTLSSLQFTACYDYKANEAALTACGLLDPVTMTVTYDQGASFTLSIGAYDQLSGVYYARLNESRMIHLLDATTAETIVGLAKGTENK